MMISRVLVLGLALAGFVFAQEQAEWKPACNVVLKYTPDDFLTEYGKRTDFGGSEAGQDQGASVWADCKNAQSILSLKNFPKLKARLIALRKLEWDFILAESDLASQTSGGGTMFAHMPARFATSIELHLERLIKLTTTKAGAVTSSKIQVEYRKASAALTARFKRVNNPSKATLEYTTKTAWMDTVKTYEKAFAGIKPIMGNKADTASLEIIGFLAQGLFADTI
jgi:hypothetical protein